VSAGTRKRLAEWTQRRKPNSPHVAKGIDRGQMASIRSAVLYYEPD